MDGNSPKPYTKEEVDAISSIEEAAQLLDDNDINWDNVENLKEMKQLLLKTLNVSSTNSMALHMFEEIIADDQDKRKQLSDIYQRFKTSLWQSLNSQLQNSMTEGQADFIQKVEGRLCSIRNQDCPILVAGETGAGKSTLLNLLLGEEVLPYAVLSCTSTICEIKHGVEKTAVVHYNDRPNEHIDLSGCDNKAVQAQLSQFVNIKERSTEHMSIIDKVEVFWPLPILKDSVFIVDSPGIGESEEVDRKVLEYLDKAFAFIYVINSGNAGGVQEDRIKALLKKVADKTNSDPASASSAFDSSSAIFVFNKWDEVPEEESELVKQRTLEQLEHCWTGLDEKNVFYISVTEAQRKIRAGLTSESYNLLVQGIKKLIPISMENKLKIQYQWLNDQVKRLGRFINARISNARKTVDERRKDSDKITRRLVKLEHHFEEVMEKLQAELNMKVQAVTEKVYDHLKSDDVYNKLRNWNESQLPDLETIQDIIAAAHKMVENAIRQEVVDLEKEQEYFKKAKLKLFSYFRQECGYVEQELTSIECSSDDTSTVAPDVTSPSEQTGSTRFGIHLFSKTDRAVIAFAAPLWIPLALVAGVFALPIIGGLALKERISNAADLQEYHKNRVAWMNKLLKEYINHIDKEYTVNKLVEKQLQTLAQILKNLEKTVPKLIAADKREQQNIMQERRTQSQQLKEFNPMKTKCNDVQGDLLLFFTRHLRSTFISEALLNMDDRRVIGNGSFAGVYKVMMKVDDRLEMVAIKRMKEELNNENIIYLYTEEDALRKLKHRNIVHFMGTFYENGPDGEKINFIMGLCKYNLAFLVLKDEDEKAREQRIPYLCLNKSVAERRQALKFIVTMASQLADALKYVHSLHYIHRDLKMENILIAEDDSLKLADVGLTKHIENMSNTVCGTGFYTAPEVLTNRPYNQMADMYSFGMIMWELWHGKRVFSGPAWENEQHMDTINHIVHGGSRPDTDPEDQFPCKEWYDIMTRCWHGEQTERYAAEKCANLLAGMCSDLYISQQFKDNRYAPFGPVTVHRVGADGNMDS